MNGDNSAMKPGDVEALRENLSAPGSLVAAIVQDRSSKEVLMLAWMNREALDLTLATKKATFWSRSRQEIWIKGETSRNSLHIHEFRYDCDADAILLLADAAGPACHTGEATCFHFELPLSE